MNIVEWLQRIMVGFGAAWVMWLMLGLSVVSVAIILERAWYFWSLRDDLGVLAKELRAALEISVEDAQRRMEASPSVEAQVVLAGLSMAHRGHAAAEEAMSGALALSRMKLERRLAYLGTLGNNAPFIGLFGTVIGVVGAFAALGEASKTPVAQATSQALAPAAVMSSIAEALVATAVGLAVAIPAVASNNLFQRMIRATLANTEALSRILLAHLKSEPMDEDTPAAAGPYRAGKGKHAPAPAPTKGGGGKKAEEKKAKDAEDEDEEEG
ncbi:MAG: MotA/TolQ/ExbB proton channel family protein [Minicystis sp.]